eukprot:GHVO01017566.1.p1 GENE.GHVO01017566.1~~GHVO01017566.1.p1  ORF type:complete len:297 (+),score=69.94 GHVO01017566.1:135-1025(+)
MKWHPDKHKDDTRKKAEEIFKDVGEAYDVLSDKEKRQVYDRYGEEGLKGVSTGPGGQTFHYSGVDPSEVFASFFRTNMGGGMGGFDDDDLGGFGGIGFPGGGFVRMGSNRGHGGPAKKPKRYSMDLNVTLEELYGGCKKKMKINRTRWSGPTAQAEAKVLEIDIKPGWKDGTRLTFDGEGDQEDRAARPGDIIFIIMAKKHDRFERQGNDLIHRISVPLVKALTGFTVPVILLDGRRIDVAVDEIVDGKKSKLVRGEGMPLSKSPNQKGDLILQFDVNFPESLTNEQKTKIREALK